MPTVSQDHDSFGFLLSRTLERQGYDCRTVKGRTEAGRRYGVSHQTLANWIAGSLPPSTRIPLLAAAMGVGETKLRRVIEQQRHVADDANAPDGSTDTDGAST